ncbi:hypothetical protein [Muriicola sp.]
MIDLRPDTAGAFINRGNAYFRQGLYRRPPGVLRRQYPAGFRQ